MNSLPLEGVSTESLSRYETIRDLVLEQYATIYLPTLRTNSLVHTAMVDSYITLLAKKRQLPLELAKIAALLHDTGRYLKNTSKGHAKVGALWAKEALENTELFSLEEIKMIVQAIAKHSNKAWIDDPFDEVLKDADTLAFWALNPSEKSSAIRQKRLEACFKELNLPLY